ncbi:MAG: hypothetical protein KY464_15580 [Gemmatimonadetes bacterium]|nr:hypothetical protein [Gemmatimonadota bacterium]
MSRPETTDSLRAVLLSLPSRVDILRLDRLWVFPTKQLSGRESGLLVLSLLPTEQFPEDHRQILTLRYESDHARPKAAPPVAVEEQGWAPADRLARVIGGVVARTHEEHDPEEHTLAGDPERWSELLREYGAAVVDRVNGE